MIHPDVEAALMELTAQLVPEEQVTVRLNPNFTSGPMPVVLITAEVPGADVLSTVQAEFEIYHSKRSDAKTLTNVLWSHLVDQAHSTQAGFLDRVWERQKPKEHPYQYSGVERFRFVVNVDTRPIG
ncbi:hypothetical protein [Brevibacterium sp.]|uniref:hypothetical protein n=1 Tax=Brevibacterium sp. TaxID=1701 RepID=UPI0028125888|nr:hypothetical protein [Brevibacterium sp.]